jgi:predicted hydrolase (HD superfamily)
MKMLVYVHTGSEGRKTMLREEALMKLDDWVKSPSLRRHAYAVEAVMRAAATRYGELGADPNKWALAGLLHDADYEIVPEEHPRLIVEWLKSNDEPEIAHAISAHGITWGVPYLTQMDRALVACDELTGFIVACALLRPDGILSLNPASVLKKLKNTKFASGVDRTEVYGGVLILGVELTEHIDFVISALRQNMSELGLEGNIKEAS